MVSKSVDMSFCPSTPCTPSSHVKHICLADTLANSLLVAPESTKTSSDSQHCDVASCQRAHRVGDHASISMSSITVEGRKRGNPSKAGCLCRMESGKKQRKTRHD